MSTIYAPLNSVNTYRTVRTELPLDIELTRDEKNELIELERLVDTSNFIPEKLAKRFDIHSTENVGIHYFCIEKNFALHHLAKNPHIAPLIAYLIERKIETTSPANERSIRRYLLTNPVVGHNLDIFKAIFAKAPHGNDLMYTLVGILPKVSAAVLMFLISNSDMIFDGDKRYYIEAATIREDEIYAWTAEHAPDFSDLPLSWVLKAYGL